MSCGTVTAVSEIVISSKDMPAVERNPICHSINQKAVGRNHFKRESL